MARSISVLRLVVVDYMALAIVWWLVVVSCVAVVRWLVVVSLAVIRGLIVVNCVAVIRWLVNHVAVLGWLMAVGWLVVDDVAMLRLVRNDMAMFWSWSWSLMVDNMAGF